MLERNEMMLRDERYGAMAPYAQQQQQFAPQMPDESEASILGGIFRHIWLLGTVLALSIAGACVYLKRAQPLYTSTSLILIEAERVVSSPELATSERGSYLFTQCTMIRSTPILQAMLESPDVKALPVFSQMPDQLLYLHDHVIADVGRRDDVINVSVESPRPEESAVLCNKLVDAYIHYREDQANNSGSTLVQTLEKNKDQLQVELESTRDKIGALLKSDPNLQLSTTAGDNALLQRMMVDAQELTRLNLQLLQAQRVYGPGSRQIQDLQAQAQLYDSQYRADKKDALATSDKLQQVKALGISETELTSRIDQLTRRINELEVNEDMRRQLTPVQVLEVGSVDETPSSPKKAMTLGLAGIIGLVMGSALALLRDRMDNRLRTIEEVQSIVGLPILGVVPRMPGRRTAVARAMAVHLDPRSEVAESYRTIRTAVYFGSQGNGNRAKTLLVTSPEPGDGKTTSASNLAIAIAQTGRNILLLDADFRKPTQHKNLDVKDTVGLSSVLAGIETLDRAIQRTGVEGLDILPCGPIPENPSEILNSQEFGELIDRLALKYDHILFDSPPANLVTDARILGAVCDASILVLRADKSTRKAAEHARNALLSVGANILGLIVNDVPRGKGYEVYGGSYYGTPEMRTRSGNADYSNSASPIQGIARLPKPAAEVSESKT